MDTEMERTLYATKEEQQYDLCAKRLLGNKSILAHILVRTVKEFKGMNWRDVVPLIEGEPVIGEVPIDLGLTNRAYTLPEGKRIVGLNTVSEEVNEGKATFDIVTYVRVVDGRRKIIINVEAQKDCPKGYNLVNRGIFYESRLISSQKERDFTENNYDDIQQAYSIIWVCLNAKQCSLNYIHLKTDCLLGDDMELEIPDLFHLIMIGVPNELPPNEKQYELHRLLSTLFSANVTEEEKKRIIREEYHILKNENVEREVTAMCNLSQGVKEWGIEIGLSRGREEGREETILELVQEGVITLQIAAAKLSLTVDEVIKQMTEGGYQIPGSC